MINGVINVNKPKGFTSHDVVAKLRGIFHQKKIGHTGTLDPDATGVLPVCLGSGTKLCDMLTEKTKIYRAVMLLGITTDTEDISGTVLCETTPEISEEKIKGIVMDFVGEYEQIPPMYSALKVNGQKLYELARQGKVIERKPRPVVIEDIQIESVCLPRVTFTVTCSKGTYIRSLCRDIGEKAGCGACMEELQRIKSGRFSIQYSYTLEEIEKYFKEGRINEIVKSVDLFFDTYDKIVVTDRNAILVSNGNMFKADKLDTEFVRVYLNNEANEERFAGIYRYDEQNGFYKPVKMFSDGE